jgi:hypothetical protein
MIGTVTQGRPNGLVTYFYHRSIQHVLSQDWEVCLGWDPPPISNGFDGRRIGAQLSSILQAIARAVALFPSAKIAYLGGYRLTRLHHHLPRYWCNRRRYIPDLTYWSVDRYHNKPLAERTGLLWIFMEYVQQILQHYNFIKYKQRPCGNFLTNINAYKQKAGHLIKFDCPVNGWLNTRGLLFSIMEDTKHYPRWIIY